MSVLVITIVAIIAVVCSALIFFWIGYKRGVEHGVSIMDGMYYSYIHNLLRQDMPEEKL